VLELSSYQIDLTESLDCDVAVLLNVTPDHLDRYESFEAYAASKARLFEMQSPSRVRVINVEDPQSALISRALNFRQGPDDLTNWTAPFDGWLNMWPALPGWHNVQNACAAIAVCRNVGVDDERIFEGLKSFPGLPHRMERVREKDGVLFVNDSKATNPTATAPALAAFERIRWICGGQAKTDNLDECAPYFGHVASAYTIGEATDLFEKLLSPHIPVKNCGKLEVAVREAAADAEPGDTVLLSPACASFDQFRDFEDRGDQFRALVGAL
jgi:UDP-N-acetylmuramoylalanine--D-glutamate ligase